MFNFLYSKSQLVLSVIVFTMTSGTALVSPVWAEDTTTNLEQSTSPNSSPNSYSSSQELLELLNSDDLKFSLLEKNYDFTPSVLNTSSNSELEKNSFTQANQYSLQADFQVSEFEQFDNVDFAFIFDFAQ